MRRFGFAEAGFENRRKRGAPDEVWALLRVLARGRGVLGTGDGVRTKGGGLKQKVSALRDRLRALLALDDDPFRPTNRGRPYRTRFAIRSEGAATFPTPPGATWDDVTVTETAVGRVEIGAGGEARGVGYVPGEDGGPGRWEGATGAGERRRHSSLADLGLAGSEAGTALAAVLRAGGRLARSEDDPNLLALGAALSRFFGFDDPPFAFDPRRRVWIARFESSSIVPASDR